MSLKREQHQIERDRRKPDLDFLGRRSLEEVPFDSIENWSKVSGSTVKGEGGKKKFGSAPYCGLI